MNNEYWVYFSSEWKLASRSNIMRERSLLKCTEEQHVHDYHAVYSKLVVYPAVFQLLLEWFFSCWNLLTFPSWMEINICLVFKSYPFQSMNVTYRPLHSRLSQRCIGTQASPGMTRQFCIQKFTCIQNSCWFAISIHIQVLLKGMTQFPLLLESVNRVLVKTIQHVIQHCHALLYHRSIPKALSGDVGHSNVYNTISETIANLSSVLVQIQLYFLTVSSNWFKHTGLL